MHPRSGNPRLGFRHFVLRPDWAMDSKSYHKRLPLPRHLFSSANYLSLILPSALDTVAHVVSDNCPTNFGSHVFAAHQRPHQRKESLPIPAPLQLPISSGGGAYLRTTCTGALSQRLAVLASHKYTHSLISRDLSFARLIAVFTLQPRT